MKTDKDLFIFIHIPKCAGTTLRENILLNYSSKQVLCIYKEYNSEFMESVGVENFISSISEKRKSQIKIIIGHNVHYGIHKLFHDRTPRYITFIRNPARRMVSLYNWMRTNSDNDNNSVDSKRLMHNGAIVQFGMKWFELNRDTLHNRISKFLYYKFFSNLLNEFSEKNLNQVFSILDKFYFIGITENKTDMDFICYILGLKKFSKNVNVSLKYVIPNLLENTLKEIENQNKIDMKLYDFALKRNAEFKENYPNFEKEIKEYQSQKNKYFRSFSYNFFRINKFIITSNSQKISYTKEIVSKIIISKRKYKWIFIIGCYNSGTTLLSRILEQHPQIAGLPDEGQFLTSKLNTPREVGVPRLWTEKEALFTIGADEKKKSAETVLKDWQKQVSKVKAKYILEKSPPNIARLLWLQNNFPNAHFIHIVRNGYAVSLGIEELVTEMFGDYENLLGKAANQWQRSSEIFQRDKTKLNKVLEISYEELTENPRSTLNKITDFLKIEDISSTVLNKQYSPHRLESKIKNMNYKRLEKMTDKQKKLIESKADKMLKYYGYEK